VVFGLTNRREIWVRHGVPMRNIFQKIADKVEQKDRKSERARRASY
jgi:hypothetical protein